MYNKDILTPEDQQVIESELQLLAKVQSSLLIQSLPQQKTDTFEDVMELRDSLADIKPEDVPATIAHMERLVLLQQHQQRDDAASRVNVKRPYFAHMKLKENGRVRDVLIGDQNCISSDIVCPIIDWKNAPLSKIFYQYEEGDEYVEEIGGREVEGEVVLRRSLSIQDGELLKIIGTSKSYAFQEGQWTLLNYEAPKLEIPKNEAVIQTMGGQSKKPQHYGVDRHLQEITALIDPKQFEIITQPNSGVVIIQGGAGSGKTTVALHRLAYLVSKQPHYFHPSKVVPIVFNKALAKYMSKVLPALGVNDVRPWVFQDWISHFRRRFLRGLPGKYSDRTPVVVIEMKKHTAMLQGLRDMVKQQEREFFEGFERTLGSFSEWPLLYQAWQQLSDRPIVARIQHLSRWIKGHDAISGVRGCPDHYALRQRFESLLSREYPGLRERPESMAIQIWEEALIHRDRLQTMLDTYAKDVFKEDQVDDIHRWAVQAYEQRHANELHDQTDARTDHKEGQTLDDFMDPSSMLDEEDDTLLLLLYLMTVGPFRGKQSKLIQYHHLLLDEAQDFSPIELELMLHMMPKKRPSMTLAGDMDQKIMIGQQMRDWTGVVSYLGLESTAIKPLSVGYRNTHEIMSVAKPIIEPISVNREWNAVRHGPPVEYFQFQNHGGLIDHLSKALINLAYSNPGAYVGVLARYMAQARLIYEGLQKADVPGIRLVQDQDFSFTPGVEITDIAQVKGLEFDNVVLIDADTQSFPDDDLSRHLLYVGVTRPTHQLWLMSCHKPSRLLPMDLIQHNE